MGLNLLRIARNDYVGRDYGERLVSRAKELLRGRLTTVTRNLVAWTSERSPST
jgi:hypothetical protein